MRPLAAVFLVLLLAGCASQSGGAPKPGKSQPPRTSPYLIGRRGVIAPEADALQAISFKPFVPTHHAIAVALIPPFSGPDSPQNEGIAYEYTSDQARRFMLSQWPAHGGSVAKFPALDLHELQCTNVHGFPGARPNQSRGIVWMSARGMVFSLQPDGGSDARTVQAEWRRLIRRGACR